MLFRFIMMLTTLLIGITLLAFCRYNFQLKLFNYSPNDAEIVRVELANIHRINKTKALHNQQVERIETASETIRKALKMVKCRSQKRLFKRKAKSVQRENFKNRAKSF